MMRGASHPKTHWAVRLCAGLRVDLFRAVLLLPFLLVAGWGGAARAMTVGEFNQYWIGDGLNAAGRCSTIVHPRCLTVPDSVTTLRHRALVAGSANARVKAALDLFWTQNLPAQFGGGGNGVTNGEMLGMVAAAFFDSTRWATPTAIQACTTFFGVAVDANFDCNWPLNQQDAGSWWGDYSATAAAYDLLYEKLNAKRKRAAIRKLSTAMRINRYSDIDGSLIQYANGKALPLMAIYGDSANTSFNEAIRDTLIKNWTFRENRCMPCWEQVETIGYSEQYWARRWTNQAAAMLCLSNAMPGYPADSDSVAGVTLWDTGRLANAGRFYRFSWRPGLLQSVQGYSSVGMERMPSKWDTDEYNARVIASFLGAIYDDPYSWALGNYLGKRNLGIGPVNASLVGSFQTLFWESPTKYASYDWREAPRFAWAPKMGVLLARNRWGIDSTGVVDTSIRTSYFPAWANAAGHFNAGHWNGAVGDWNQVFDRGRRYTDFEDHMTYYHYFANSILIRSAGESFGQMSVVDEADANGAPCEIVREDVPNAGWQEQGSITAGAETWPACVNNDANNAGRRRVIYRGELLEDSVDSLNAIYRVSADFDSAYDASEKRYVRRSWLYDGGQNVVVWDQVQVRSGVSDVQSVIGLINAPQVTGGTVEVLAGAGTVDPDSAMISGGPSAQGGIYKVIGAEKLLHTNGAGRAWIYPLQIENTTDAATGYLYAIGGPGKNTTAKTWAQSKYPCAENTYVANASQTGWAFWTWNGGDVTDGWNMSPGAHTQGGCVQTLACGDGSLRWRISGNDNTQPAAQSEINAPNNNLALGHGFDAGDWTVYATVSNPSNLDVCEVVYLVQLQPTTGSEPTVEWSRSGQVAAVAVNDTMLVMTSPSTLARPDSIYWEQPYTDTNTNATIRVVGLLPGVQYGLYHDDAFQSYKTTSAKGTVSWAHTENGVSAFKLVLKTSATGACCAADGTCTVVAAGSCTGTYRGDGSTCSPNPCPQPTGACCRANGTCLILRQAGCEALGHTWLGAGTDCEPNACPQPTGACCAADGTCSVVEVADCTGTYLGDGELCSPNPCPQPLDTAACCTSNGTFCTNLTLADCAAAGGVYLDGQICEDDPCYDTTPRACCLPSGACVLVSNTDCTNVLDGVSLAGTTCNLSCLGYPYGACCADDGTCTYVIESDCTGGSVWQGGGVQCNPCVDQTTGACCVDNDCTIKSAADCATAGGDYFGDGAPCPSDTCEPQVVGACCFFEGSCRIIPEAQCHNDGGLYLGDNVDCEFDLCGMRILLNGLRLMRRYLDD